MIDRHYHRYDDDGVVLRILVTFFPDRIAMDTWFSDHETTATDPRAGRWFNEIVEPVRSSNLPVYVKSASPGRDPQFYLLPPNPHQHG